MNAVISGTAGQALLIEGESLRSLDVENPSSLVVRTQADLPYLFGEGRDLCFIEDTDLDSIVKELNSESNLSLALDLTLISLDEELEDDIRKDAIRDLDELLVDAKLRERLEGILYARPLPREDADLWGALNFCNKSSLSNSFSLLTDLDRRETLVSKVSAAWDVIPTQVFGGNDQKTEFQRVAVERGLFRSLVLTVEKLEPVSNFLLKSGLDNSIKQLRNYRLVLQGWSSPFRASTELRVIRSEVEDEEAGETKHRRRRRRGRRIDIDRQAVLNEVNRRKAIISGAIQRRDFEIVRELTNDLVDYQLHSGEAKHLAMSLCDLAMEAKELEMFSLQLELTERSINVAPDDGWSWAQYGDALLNTKRLNDALTAYRDAIAFGAGVVAKNGRAVVLKAQGRLGDALAAFDEVIAQYPEDVFAKNGRAEVLKAQGRLPEALLAFDKVIAQHPEDVVAKTGRAEVLKVQGRLNDALSAFDEVIAQHPEHVMAKHGRVTVLVASRRYEEALVHLGMKEPVTLQDWIGYHILGMIRLRTGQMVEAIRIFDDGVRNNPWPSSREYFSRALALAWLRGRDFQKASNALEHVKSPLLQPVANVLRIHAFGAQGKIEPASIAYESLSANPDLRSTDLTQELHSQFILKKPARKTEEWILDKETEILLLAA